jgi:hypothetical protein
MDPYRKGSNAERELAAVLSAMFGCEVRRTARPFLPGLDSRAPDCYGLKNIHIESKKRERLSLGQSIAQAEHSTAWKNAISSHTRPTAGKCFGSRPSISCAPISIGNFRPGSQNNVWQNLPVMAGKFSFQVALQLGKIYRLSRLLSIILSIFERRVFWENTVFSLRIFQTIDL